MGENDVNDVQFENGIIEECKTFRHLGVSVTWRGKSEDEIDIKIVQGKKAINHLNAVK